MKKYSLMMIGIVAITIMAGIWKHYTKGHIIIRDVAGGGKSGYNYSYFKQEDGIEYMKCRGEGYEQCPYTLSDSQSREHLAVKYAMDRIAENKLNGKFEDENLGFTIAWEAKDNKALTSKIKVWPIGDQEPIFD